MILLLVLISILSISFYIFVAWFYSRFYINSLIIITAICKKPNFKELDIIQSISTPIPQQLLFLLPLPSLPFPLPSLPFPLPSLPYPYPLPSLSPPFPIPSLPYPLPSLSPPCPLPSLSSTLPVVYPPLPYPLPVLYPPCPLPSPSLTPPFPIIMFTTTLWSGTLGKCLKTISHRFIPLGKLGSQMGTWRNTRLSYSRR